MRRRRNAALGALAWPLKPLESSTPIEISLRLGLTGGGAKVESALIKSEGSLSPDRFSLDWQWQGLALQWLGPYLQAQAPLRLSGLFSGKGGWVHCVCWMRPPRLHRSAWHPSRLALTWLSFPGRHGEQRPDRPPHADIDWAASRGHRPA